MPKIEIYTSQFCGYCYRAKKLLSQKGVEYIEFDVIADSSKRDEMVQRAGGRITVPQIFIDGNHVGGSDELHALERAGKLDPMLGRRSFDARSQGANSGMRMTIGRSRRRCPASGKRSVAASPRDLAGGDVRAARP